MMVEAAVDLKILATIGEGGCGKVYLVEDREGERLVLKRFDEAAVNLPLLDQMTRRLASGGWPPGVVPVIRTRSGSGSGIRLSPLLAELGSDGEELRPLSLQHRLGDHPGVGSWPLVKAMARALADMHERGVAHGNLKPGNVFIGPEDEVRLADWALGNMPDVAGFRFTDALLYQPPEQLRDPSGYTRAAGFRWDVFAFGVLAYRVLTGRFPRCHRVYRQVAPPAGTSPRQDLQVDLEKIASNLEAEAAVSWPDNDPGPEESELRQCIDRCLSLDPAKRPADMAGVAAGFHRIESAFRTMQVGAEAGPRWSHIHPSRLDSSREDPLLPERDLWDFEEEMDWMEDLDLVVLNRAFGGLPAPRDRSPAALSPAVVDEGSVEDVWMDPESVPPSGIVSHPGGQNGSPAASEALIAEPEPGPAVPPTQDAGGWLEGESADWESPPDAGRKSRSRGRPVSGGSAPAMPVERSGKWSLMDHLGLMLLAGILVTGGAWLLVHSILKLPEKPAVWQVPAFPLAGERIQLESATCYWRKPVTEGPRADMCRRGTFVLPVIEISVTGGTSMIRVLFKNEEGMTTGDPLIRTVRPGDLMKLTGTAGLEDSAAWAAYRLGRQSPWSVQIDEIPSGQPAGGDSRQLLNMNLPGSLR